MLRPFAHGPSSRRLLSGTIAAFWVCSLAVAQDWSKPARELASQIRNEIHPPARLAWSVHNRSGHSGDELASIRRAIGTELRNAGYRTGKWRNPTAHVEVTISENFESYLWVAQVLRGEKRFVVMVPVPRARAIPPPGPPGYFLSRKMLLSREEQILDLVPVPSPEITTDRLLTLGRTSVTLYEKTDETWQVVTTAPIVPLRIWPRDMQGQLLVRADSTFAANLPGEQCTGSVHNLANLDCKMSETPWSLSDAPSGGATATFVANRNSFTNLVSSPDPQPLPFSDFYSAASVEAGKVPFWVVAPTTGEVQLLGPQGHKTEIHGWGSQLAAVSTTCNSGVSILATRPGDYAQTDAVQAFQINQRAPEAVTAAVDFPGPVTLLRAWGAEGVAFAVVRNLQSGFYEAYRLSVNCSN